MIEPLFLSFVGDKATFVIRGVALLMLRVLGGGLAEPEVALMSLCLTSIFQRRSKWGQ